MSRTLMPRAYRPRILVEALKVLRVCIIVSHRAPRVLFRAPLTFFLHACGRFSATPSPAATSTTLRSPRPSSSRTARFRVLLLLLLLLVFASATVPRRYPPRRVSLKVRGSSALSGCFSPLDSQPSNTVPYSQRVPADYSDAKPPSNIVKGPRIAIGSRAHASGRSPIN